MNYQQLRDIAAIAHAATNAYKFAIGEPLNRRFDMLSPDAQDSLVNGVRAVIDGEITSPAASHAEWVKDRARQGWAYATIRDDANKLHPNMLEFDRLPPEQQMKDFLFVGIVSSLSGKTIDSGPPAYPDLRSRVSDLEGQVARMVELKVSAETLSGQRAEELLKSQDVINSLKGDLAIANAKIAEYEKGSGTDELLDSGANTADPSPEPPAPASADPAPALQEGEGRPVDETPPTV